MSGITADGEIKREPGTKNLGRRRAAGIYGAIVAAAVLDTVGGHVSTAALVVSVVTKPARQAPPARTSRLRMAVLPTRPAGGV